MRQRHHRASPIHLQALERAKCEPYKRQDTVSLTKFNAFLLNYENVDQQKNMVSYTMEIIRTAAPPPRHTAGALVCG